MDHHLEKATQDIIAAIPNENFSGIGIIDWEYWRPQWELNWGLRNIYKNRSREVVQARNPHWDSEMIELVARLEFEQAAKSLMDSTLRLVKELRPMGHWGFYHFPYCDNNKRPDGTCNPASVLSNNNITWLFDSSTALYPSIYFHGFQKYKRDNAMNKLMETFRVRNMSRHQDVPIYVYTRFNYSHSSLYYSKVRPVWLQAENKLNTKAFADISKLTSPLIMLPHTLRIKTPSSFICEIYQNILINVYFKNQTKCSLKLHLRIVKNFFPNGRGTPTL